MTQDRPEMGASIHHMPLPDVELLPTELPFEDGEPMESPWHRDAPQLLMAAYATARGPEAHDYYMGANMFVYFSPEQVHSRDFKGPDLFFVFDVDGRRERLSWIAWLEDWRYPDVIFEMLSASTERYDLTVKKDIYEHVFRTAEYFCVAPSVERLFGWRLVGGAYEPIAADERGWLWSEQLGHWIGAWEGSYLHKRSRWPRLYAPDGRLAPLPAEVAGLKAEQATLRAQAEVQRADELAARVAALEAELARLRGG
jgi:Uma2 family endonuclease/ribosomal protein L29